MLLLALALPALAQDPATNAAAAAVSAKDVVAERTRAMVARLDRVAVPEIEFKAAPLVDICSFLRDCTGCYCELGVVSKISAWAEGPLQRRLDREGVRVSISMTNAPLGQIALRAAEQAGAELVAGESFLLFRDHGAPPWDPSPFFARPGADAAAAEEVLDRVRIAGSDCRYADLRDILRVVQTRAVWRDPDELGIPFGPDGIPPAPSKDGRGEWPSVWDRNEYELRATLDRREDGAICFPMPPRIVLREALEILANAAGVCFVVEPDGSLSVAESGRPAPDAPGDPASARRLPLPAAREATLAALSRIRARDAFAKTEDKLGLRDFLRRLDEAARAAEPSDGGLRFDVDPDVPAEARCHGEDIRHLSDGCLRELLDAALFSNRLPWFVRADGTIVIRPAFESPGEPAPRPGRTSDVGAGDALCDGFGWDGILTVVPFACTRPLVGCFGPFEGLACERIAETNLGRVVVRYPLRDGRIYAKSESRMERDGGIHEDEQFVRYSVVFRSIYDVWSTNRLASPSDRMEDLGIEVRFDPAGMEGGAFAFGDRIVPVGEDGSLGEVPERVARSLPLVAKGRRFRAMLEDCDPDRCILHPSSDGALRFLVPARPVEGEPMTFRAEISLSLRAEPDAPLRTARRAEAERDRAEARLDAWRVPALALSGRPFGEALDAVRAAAVREGPDGGEKAPSFRLDFDDERSSVWPKLVPVVESFSATNATLREAVGALAGAAGLAAREECGKVVLGGTIGSDRLPLRLPEAGGAAQARLEPIALTLVKQCEIPEVEFRDGLLSDVLSFLGAAAEEYREFRLPEGFAIRLDPAAGDPDAHPRFSIHRMRIPMPELLDAVASNCGLVWRAEGAEIVFHPK